LDSTLLFSSASYAWGLQGICQLHRIPFAPQVVLQQVPPPYTLLSFQRAAKEIGLKSAARNVPISQLPSLPLPCLAVLKPEAAGATPVKARETDPTADPVFWKANPFAVADLNKRLEDLKTQLAVPRVNMFEAFGAGDYNSPMACNGSASCRSFLSADGLHPSADGYQKMAEAVFAKIVEVFETVH